MSRVAAAIQEMPEREQPIAERFRIVALQYCDADAAASLMEELKTTNLAKMKASIIAEQGSMPDNTAERLAKCSDEWEEYVKAMCGNRAKATKLKLQLEYLRMLDKKEDREAWAARTEQRMSR
jgi:hypothetical protein